MVARIEAEKFKQKDLASSVRGQGLYLLCGGLRADHNMVSTIQLIGANANEIKTSHQRHPLTSLDPIMIYPVVSIRYTISPTRRALPAGARAPGGGVREPEVS